MKTVVALLLLVVVAGAVAFYGCGPRVAVIQDKLVKQFDELLGSLDVKKKKIEQDSARLAKDLQDVRDKRIETEVRLENLTARKAGSEKSLKEILAKMETLNGMIRDAGDAGTIEKNGRTFTAEQLNTTAKDLVAQHERAKKEIETSLASSIGAMTRALDFLKKQEAAGNQMMADIRAKMEEIENKKAAIDTARSSALLVGGETSITEKYKDLQSQIENLSVDIETAFRREEENLKDLDVNTRLADELLQEDTDLKATQRLLDSILGTTPTAPGDGK